MTKEESQCAKKKVYQSLEAAMCDTISRPSGVDIETVAELREFLNGGRIITYVGATSLIDDDCLCWVDLAATLEQNGVKSVYRVWGYEVEIERL